MTLTAQPRARTGARTLTEALRRSAPDGLVALLELRPDLRHPVPHDLSELTAQAVTSRSVARALDGLTAWQRQVAEALAALPDPTEVATVAALLVAPEPDCARAVADLRDRALLWGDDDALHLVRAVREQFGPYPGSLAPPSPRPLSEPQLDEALADLDPAAAEVLRRLTWSPTGAFPSATRRVADTARGPVEQLLARRLLAPLDDETVVLPREVAWRLRDGRFSPDPVSPGPPPVGGRSRPPALTDRAAVGAAYGLVHDLEQLADVLTRRPYRLLRDGGLGARDVAALARELPGEPEYAGFLLECGAETVLGTGPDGRLLPTREFDRWLRRDGAERWRQVVRGWLESDRLPSRALQSDAHPLGPEGDLPYAVPLRRAWLDRLAAAGPGLVPDPGELEQAVRWVRPRLGRVPLRLDHGLAWLTREAGWLGLTGVGATSALATWLAGPDAPLPPAVADLFPAPVDSIILQADLTAVAPGPLPHRLAGELRLLAAQESRGGGGVFRFSAGSLRHAFDAGWSASQVRDWLDQHSSTPVPQPLSYLVDDVARRHGSIRVGRASTYVSVDDPARLAELLAEPQAAALGLRQIGPGVLVALADAEEVTAFVERLGHHPAAERSPEDQADPGQTLRAPAVRRSRTPLPDPVELVAGLLSDDRETAAVVAGSGGESTSTAETLHRLHAAVRSGQPVDLRYVGDDGAETSRRLSPLDLAGGVLRAVDLGSARVVRIPLARIVFAPAAGSAE